ncbi:MAG TPA: gamma-glutamylcyclotransferase family protein [Acidimicrobiia bacterium]|nr:gamma-glutamylcyclotransferase family protein [Acidimicrobiia bacterium]
MSERGRRRPLFVYGTLRPGQPNWEWLLARASERVLAGRLPGVVLLDCGRYPAAVERPDAGGAAGEVVWIQPRLWPAVVAALDRLEGYESADPDSLFVRAVRAVETVEGQVECLVYLAGPMLAGSARLVVPEGDWVVHCRSERGRGH